MRAVRLTLLSVVLVFIGAAAAAAQNTGTVTGQVTDASTGQPLSGVQMQVAGTNIGGLTDQNGRYLLTRVPAGEQSIRAVLIGFAQVTETVTVSAGGTAVADFELETSAVPLEAVIVSAATGRQQRSRELGAQVSAIEVEQLNPAPITSFADALGGRTSGVVMQDVNGTTGSSQRIRIRGANSLSLSNEPLVFVDGVQISTDFGDTFGVGGQEDSRLNDLNPNEIASMEIVKGPAASALYGTAAANGVILITTKRGRPGTTQWSAWVEQGSIEDVTDYELNYLTYTTIDPNAPLFDSDGFFNRADLDGDGTIDTYDYCYNRRAAAGSCTQDGTLSFNTMEDSRTTPYVTGNRGRYGASVRGGTEQVRYFVSGQYETEDGIISINTNEKANFRANLDAELSETADLSVSFGYTDNQLKLNNNDNSIFSPIINGILGQAYYVPPDESREYGAPVNDANYGFGFSMEELATFPTYLSVDRYITSANLRWRPTSWLTLNAQGGLDLASSHAYETLQPGKLPIAYSYAQGFRDSQRKTDYLYTGLVSGVSTFELTSDLVSTTTLGTQYTLDNEEDTECYGYSLVPGTASCGTVADGYFIDENFFEVRTIGGYVQQELAWRDRVFVAGGVRADDNSAFGTDFNLAYYPSASLSWVVGEEPWFPQVSFLNTLRVRGAWGVSGLRPGFRDAITLYSPTTVATAGGDRPGISLSVTGNTQLKPERTTEYEFGFDTGLFSDRITAEFTYFNKTSNDALISRRLPGSLGLTTSVIDNLGSIENAGTELAVNLSIIETPAFGFSAGFTNTSLKNTVKELGEGVEDIIFNRGLQRHAEGYTAGGFWSQEVTWDDADGNGLLTNDEVNVADEDTFIGPALPKWQRTIFADLRIFDWLTASTLFEGRGGHYTSNDTESFRCGFRSTRGCAAVADPNASLYEQARYIADRYLGSPYAYVEKADFYRWRELSVSLRAPASLVQQFDRLSGLQLTLAGRNLALWTDYSGLDPETVEGGGNANFSQSEFNTQPPVRYLMVRLDYTF